MSEAYSNLYTGVLLFLAVCLFLALLRAIRGPRVADRIMGVNMTGSLVICSIAVLSARLNESFLLDVGLVYGMMSFLAVVVLGKIYITLSLHRKDQGEKEDE